MGCFELAFYGLREGAGHKFYGPNNALDLWEVTKVNPQNMVHLTEKPVELAARAMQYSSRPGENVLDLFGGSGSILIGGLLLVPPQSPQANTVHLVIVVVVRPTRVTLETVNFLGGWL